METIMFTDRGAFYGCNKPGNQAGEYVKADIARDLLEALKDLAREEYRDDYDPILDRARLKARAAIAKAEGRE